MTDIPKSGDPIGGRGFATADRDSGCEAHPAEKLTPSPAPSDAADGHCAAAKDGNVTPSFEEFERANVKHSWRTSDQELLGPLAGIE